MPARVAILPAFTPAENSELFALITGDPWQAKKPAKKYAVPAFHSDDFQVRVGACFGRNKKSA